MAREINNVSININDVSVKMTAKIDNVASDVKDVTTSMTKKFKDVDIKFDNAYHKIDGFH